MGIISFINIKFKTHHSFPYTRDILWHILGIGTRITDPCKTENLSPGKHNPANNKSFFKQKVNVTVVIKLQWFKSSQGTDWCERGSRDSSVR